jgi:hypothetical protein
VARTLVLVGVGKLADGRRDPALLERHAFSAGSGAEPESGQRPAGVIGAAPPARQPRDSGPIAAGSRK